MLQGDAPVRAQMQRAASLLGRWFGRWLAVGYFAGRLRRVEADLVCEEFC